MPSWELEFLVLPSMGVMRSFSPPLDVIELIGECGLLHALGGNER